MMPSSRWLVVVMLATTWGCSKPNLGASLNLGISGDAIGNKVQFNFQQCETQSKNIQINYLAVFRAGDGPKGKAAHCLLRTDDSKAMKHNQWVYGATMQGWKVQQCAALTPGEYDIEVGGTGTGVRRFLVKSGGSIEWRQPICQ